MQYQNFTRKGALTVTSTEISLTHEYVDQLEAELSKVKLELLRKNREINKLLVLNVNLQEQNMLLRQEIDGTEKRVFVANKR